MHFGLQRIARRTLTSRLYLKRYHGHNSARSTGNDTRISTRARLSHRTSLLLERRQARTASPRVYYGAPDT